MANTQDVSILSERHGQKDNRQDVQIAILPQSSVVVTTAIATTITTTTTTNTTLTVVVVLIWGWFTIAIKTIHKENRLQHLKDLIPVILRLSYVTVGELQCL